MSEKVVVAGAGFFGLCTAMKLAGKGYDVELLDRQKQHEFTPGIVDIFRDRVSEDKLELDLEDFLEETLVNFSEEKVMGIDPVEKRLETDSSAYNYDYLVLGLGGEHRSFGHNTENAETCYSLSDARKIKKRLENVESALIVGAGYVGLEVAGELNEKDLDVKILDVATRPMANANMEASEIALDYINRKEIDFLPGKNVETVESGKVELGTGKTIESDIVIWCTGIQASKLVQNEFNTGNEGLEVNPGLCSRKYPSVFAGGDCADTDVMKTGNNAMKQAETIVENIGKAESEDLEEFEEKLPAILVSMGDEAMLEYKDRAYSSKLFRVLKDLVRLRYFFILKKKKLKLRLTDYLN